jgi:peptidoglycan/LPS O-acetylase OafA/YrhL
LDALRGLAALWVVCYHLWNRYYPSLSTQGHVLVRPGHGSAAFWVTFSTIQYGYWGVTLFFVLSGFCIHWPQAQRHATRGTDGLKLRDFANRRFWRLYPAYFASLFFTLAAEGIFPVLGSIGKHRLSIWSDFKVGDLLYNAAFLQQVRPGSLAFNGVYWTLLFEAQFYVVYPGLLWVCRRFGFKIVLVALFIAEVVLTLHPLPIQCFFLQRLFEWFLGMFAAESISSGRRIPLLWLLTPVCFIAAVSATLNPILWPYRDVLLSVGFMGLLLAALRLERADPKKVWAFSQWGWLLGLGAMSYSLYLVHIPVIDLFWLGGHLMAKYKFISGVAASIGALMAIPAALTVAAISYRWIERPAMQYSRSPRRPQAPIVVASGAEREVTLQV